MSKLIDLPVEGIRRFYPNKEIFINIISFLSNNYPNCALIAGGAARYMLSPNENTAVADDIDIYLLNYDIGYDPRSSIREDFIKNVFGHDFAKKQLFLKKYKWLEELRYKNNQAALEYGITTLVCRPYFPNIQFICTKKPTADNTSVFFNGLTNNDILHSFDFTVCKAAIFPYYKNLVCKVSEEFMEDEKNGILRITGPINDTLMSRIYKYIKLGYTLSEESYIYILNHLSTTKDKYEQKLGHMLLTEKRNIEDFIITPMAIELYEKWFKSISI